MFAKVTVKVSGFFYTNGVLHCIVFTCVLCFALVVDSCQMLIYDIDITNILHNRNILVTAWKQVQEGSTEQPANPCSLENCH